MTLPPGAAGGLLMAVLTLPFQPAPAQSRTPDTCPPPVWRATEARQPRVIPITVYNPSRMGPAELDLLLDVTNRIWEPYGVTFQPAPAPGPVAVVVSERRDESPNGLRHVVLGMTLFSGGHATPYITLSRSAAE